MPQKLRFTDLRSLNGIFQENYWALINIHSWNFYLYTYNFLIDFIYFLLAI